MTAAAVELARFDPATHLALLSGWLRRPHVAPWWGDAAPVLERAADPGPGGDHALIVAGGRPVGYLRWQRVVREELEAAGLTEVPDGAVDLDVLLGEADAVGRGIVPQALRILLGRLRQDPTIQVVGLSTSAANEPAIRAYEKAGFRRVRCYEDPEWGPSWIMLADRPA